MPTIIIIMQEWSYIGNITSDEGYQFYDINELYEKRRSIGKEYIVVEVVTPHHHVNKNISNDCMNFMIKAVIWIKKIRFILLLLK